MVMKPEPIFAAVEELRTKKMTTSNAQLENSTVVLMSPTGRRFCQKMGAELALGAGLQTANRSHNQAHQPGSGTLRPGLRGPTPTPRDQPARRRSYLDTHIFSNP